MTTGKAAALLNVETKRTSCEDRHRENEKKWRRMRAGAPPAELPDGATTITHAYACLYVLPFLFDCLYLLL